VSTVRLGALRDVPAAGGWEAAERVSAADREIGSTEAAILGVEGIAAYVRWHAFEVSRAPRANRINARLEHATTTG